jgi:hypothetical protein
MFSNKNGDFGWAELNAQDDDEAIWLTAFHNGFICIIEVNVIEL